MNQYGLKVTNECKRKSAILQKGDTLNMYELGQIEGYKRVCDIVNMSSRSLERHHLRHLLDWANTLLGDGTTSDYERGIMTAYDSIYDL